MAKQQIVKDQIKDNVIELNTATPSFTPIAGAVYKCTTALTSLTLTNIPVVDNDIVIYFTTHSSTAFTLTATDLVGKWWNINSPTFQTDSEYVICINNGKTEIIKAGARTPAFLFWVLCCLRYDR